MLCWATEHLLNSADNGCCLQVMLADQLWKLWLQCI